MSFYTKIFYCLLWKIAKKKVTICNSISALYNPELGIGHPLFMSFSSCPSQSSYFSIFFTSHFANVAITALFSKNPISITVSIFTAFLHKQCLQQCSLENVFIFMNTQFFRGGIKYVSPRIVSPDRPVRSN